MPDVFTPSERSQIMRSVKSKGNKSTELKLISVFNELNILGWIRSYPVVGHPDFTFKKKRVVVFVDGCFWHGHDCRNLQPSSHSEYWIQKINHNKAHDIEITERFTKRGWRVIRIWECELTKKKRALLLSKLEPLL